MKFFLRSQPPCKNKEKKNVILRYYSIKMAIYHIGVNYLSCDASSINIPRGLEYEKYSMWKKKALRKSKNCMKNGGNSTYCAVSYFRCI